MGLEGLLNCWQMTTEQSVQVLARDVTGLDQQQLPRVPVEHMRVDKIRVLGDHDPLISHRNLADNRILRVIACREIQRMNRIMSMFCEESTKAARAIGTAGSREETTVG